MGKKIIIDTNVIISAFGWGGKPAENLKRVENGTDLLYMSVEQISEIKRVLEYPKLGLRMEQKTSIINLIERLARIILEKEKPRLVEGPDDMVLKPILQHNIDFVITGDKGVLDINAFDAKAVTPSEYLKTL